GRGSTIPRPYGTWVVQNLLDFAFGSGLCQAVLCASVAATARSLPPRMAATAIGIAATVIVTDVIGINRGEVIRLWAFLACFVQIPAAYACARLESRLAVLLVVSTTLLQDAVGTSMIGFAQP